MCDLDGVLHRGGTAIDGAPEAIALLREQGLRLLFATNNGTRTVSQVRQRLQGFGIEIEEGEIVTAATVTAEEIAMRDLQTKTAYVVGRGGIRSALTEIGMPILEGEDGKLADVVIVSGDFEFTYEKLHIASTAVREGAIFLATNSDPTFPDAGGLRPGAGAILAGVETASGRRAEVMGKPHLPMMKAAARRLPGADHIGIVGDQPGTDLAGGAAMGWTTILVLSGVTDTAATLATAPDLILDSIRDLPEKMELAR